jgi:hypothetical protein
VTGGRNNLSQVPNPYPETAENILQQKPYFWQNGYGQPLETCKEEQPSFARLFAEQKGDSLSTGIKPEHI